LQASRGLEYTYYEANAFKLKFPQSNKTLLVDPWLVGDLTFAGLGDWFYGGKKKYSLPPLEETSRCDLILLTQGLDDHAHLPTLKVLDRATPVVASPTAAAIVRDLGYRTVYSLAHGESCTVLDGTITIEATQGALVGPPWATRENGFVIRETLPHGVSVYYEPHCDYVGDNVTRAGPVDVMISPVKTVSMGSYPLVKGEEVLPLVKALRPKALIPLTNADGISTGILSTLINVSGNMDTVEQGLQAEIPETRFVQVAPVGQSTIVSLL